MGSEMCIRDRPYPATQVHSNVCTQLAARGRAPSCQTPPHRTTQSSNTRNRSGTAVSSNLTKVQRRVHSLGEDRADERAQPCQTPQHWTIPNSNRTEKIFFPYHWLVNTKHLPRLPRTTCAACCTQHDSRWEHTDFASWIGRFLHVVDRGVYIPF